MGLEARKGARLVSLHQAAKADHVGGEDRSEPTLWSWHVHLNALPGYLTGSLANPGISPKPRREDWASYLGRALDDARAARLPPQSIPSACI
ncbi:hypothetical protein BraRD5C2_68360 [Bradyrhizobium sp. RD5-C2]|nr:hypothetical protein BraRD5C2_68360 [Bradyrhizobium sp. RD5-C2]